MRTRLLADGEREREAVDEATRVQRRRKVALEALSLAAANAGAVFFAGRFVARWDVPTAGWWGAVAAVACVGYWIWHRSRYPAQITVETDEAVEARPRREMADDAGSIWDPLNLLVLGVGALAVVAVVVFGLLVSFIVPLMIILGFGVFFGGDDLGGVGGALLGTLLVASITEFGVVMPLCRHWGLPFGSAGPSRQDFCPPPAS